MKSYIIVFFFPACCITPFSDVSVGASFQIYEDIKNSENIIDNLFPKIPIPNIICQELHYIFEIINNKFFISISKLLSKFKLNTRLEGSPVFVATSNATSIS